MEQWTGDHLVATELADLADGHQQALCAVTLVADAQVLSASYRPYAQLLPQIERLRQSEAGHVVLESTLPEIRCLAMLLAGWHVDPATSRSPSHFAQDADWLAARAFLLQLSHIELPLNLLPTLDAANRHLARLRLRLGEAGQGVLPVLSSAAAGGATQRMAWRGWCAASLPTEEAGMPWSVQLRQRSRRRLAALLAALAAPQ